MKKSHSCFIFLDSLGISIISFHVVLRPYSSYRSSARISLPGRAARPFPVSWQRRISHADGYSVLITALLSPWNPFLKSHPFRPRFIEPSTTPLGTFLGNCQLKNEKIFYTCFLHRFEIRVGAYVSLLSNWELNRQNGWNYFSGMASLCLSKQRLRPYKASGGSMSGDP